MKRIILLSLLTIGMVTFSNAQDAYVYDLQPDEYKTNEVILKSSVAIEELTITVGIKWMQQENRIQLTFDRKTSSGNDAYFLFFPLVYKRAFVNEITDCKSRKKPLWTKSNELNYLHYFLESDNLDISDYKNCYKSLADNNEEEFEFEIKNPEDFTINLTGIYVGKTEKKPWYSFSSKDRKLEYKADPIALNIRFPQKKQTTIPCDNSEQIVAYINAQKQILKVDHDELTDAQKNHNCTLFDLIKDKIRRNFVENNDKCEKYIAVCEEIAQAIKGYNDECESIMDERCKSSAAVSSACNLSEQEISLINSRLKNLQMKINVKKKEGSSANEEYKEYQSIKTTVNGKLTSECRRKHKMLIDAFVNYCTQIESLFR